ncbi:hypothetical protein [Phenylobacterium sp.]|uniref:hypothetical protein n=1 Tax=Phenylobacterium sp. TaxID=1871053 RepID=UPI0025DB8275|nr:hypothetical protein [Phenylobacterium sp.]
MTGPDGPAHGRTLVICHDYDEAAVWAHGRLVAGGGACELVRSGELDLAPGWSHRMDGNGDAVSIRLADGRVLEGSSYTGVLNRLVTAPGSLAAFASEEDREYAEAEAVAFAMSWLGILPNVMNRPTPQGLCGAWRHITEWLLLAGRAGLATPAYSQTERHPAGTGYGSLAPQDAPRAAVLVIGDAAMGEPPSPAIGAACVRLARLAEADILGVELFEAGGGGWRFGHATAFPDLRIGGEPAVAALARRLSGAAA